jgi:tyrosine-protein kinase Etk/Wzc
MEQMEMATNELPRTSMRDFLRVLFKRKNQILLFFVATFVTVAIATFVVKPTYQATAQILVKLGRENIYMPASGSSSPVMNFNNEEQINSEIEILKSRSLAMEVLHELGPETIYEDIAKGPGGLRAAILPSKSSARTPAETALLKMQKALDVQ